MDRSGENVSVEEFQSVGDNTVVVPIESPLYEKQDLTILRKTNNSSSNNSLQIAQADASLQATEPNNPAELIEEDEQTQAKGDIFAGSFGDVSAPVLLGGAGAALLVGGLAAGGGGSSGATNTQGAGSDPAPTLAPTQQPTETPTFQPLPGSGGSPSPTNAPTAEPTNAPTQQPTEAPTGGPALGDGFAVPSFGAIPFGLPLPASPGEETTGIENGGFSYSLGEFGVAGVSGLKAGSFSVDPANIQGTEITVIDPEIALFPRGGDNSTAVLYVRDVDLLAGVSIESATALVERVFNDVSAADPQAIGTYTNVLDVPVEGDPSTLSLKVGELFAQAKPVVNVEDLTINLSAAGVVESIGNLAAFLQSSPQPGDFVPSGGFDAPDGGRYAFPEDGGDLPMPDLGGGLPLPVPTEVPSAPPQGLPVGIEVDQDAPALTLSNTTGMGPVTLVKADAGAMSLTVVDNELGGGGIPIPTEEPTEQPGGGGDAEPGVLANIIGDFSEATAFTIGNVSNGVTGEGVGILVDGLSMVSSSISSVSAGIFEDTTNLISGE